MTVNPSSSETSDGRLQEIRERIEIVLDREVRPELQEDGGGIEVVGIDRDCIVQIRLAGVCQGCSPAAISLAMQIEATVKAEVPEVRFFEPVP